MSIATIQRILQIISILLGLLTSGATAVSVSRTIDANVAASQGAMMGEATAANAPAILSTASLTGLAGLIFANSKRIAELLGKAGVSAGTTSIIVAAIDTGRLAQYRHMYSLATTDVEREGIRSTAQVAATEMFNNWFPAKTIVSIEVKP